MIKSGIATAFATRFTAFDVMFYIKANFVYAITGSFQLNCVIFTLSFIYERDMYKERTCA